MPRISEEVGLIIAEVPCVRRLVIYPGLEGQDHTIMASIHLAADRDVCLVADVQFDAMHIPDGSIEDELDKQVALGSAEALLDVDKLTQQASVQLNKIKKALAIGGNNG